jgi:hypothetical protein
VKDFLSKQIAPKRQTQDMLDAFDAVTVDPEIAKRDLGRFGEILIDGKPVTLRPTGLSLPVNEVSEGSREGHDYKWAWEPGEGALIDEDRGPERGRWVTDKPPPVQAPGLYAGESMAKRFIESTLTSRNLDEFNELDEDDQETTQAKVGTPVGCIWTRATHTCTVADLARIFSLTASHLAGINKGNPSWHPTSSATGRTRSFSQRVIDIGAIVWIPEVNHNSLTQGKGVLALSEVEAIINQRRVNGVREFLVQWAPTQSTSKGRVVQHNWPDSWETEDKMNCQRKIEEFEKRASTTIGMS